MTNQHCLNCNTILTNKYCSGCGQKADTHRISFKNFVFHDLLHGTFHIEKGMLFTAREALIRPGKAALDYIAGKRKRYYNVFYLILIITGLILFFRHFLEANRVVVSEKTVTLNEVSIKMDDFLSQKSKLIIFLFVPFAAINSFILFGRKKLNVSEHSIVSGMILLGILLISLIGNLIWFIDLSFNFPERVSNTVSIFIIVAIFFYIGCGYVNAFADKYSKFEMTFRIFLFFALIFLELFLIFVIIFGFISNWKFGQITLTPFA